MNAQSDQLPQYRGAAPTALPTASGKSWLRRNWLRLLVGLFVCGFLFVSGIMVLVFGAMRSSDVFKESVARAQSNPAVLQRLGTPVKAGFFVSGSINVSGNSGDAGLAVPISGPKGKATVSVTAHKSGGGWNYSLMQVAVDGAAERIDLLAGPTAISDNQTNENQSQPVSLSQPAQSATAEAAAPPPAATNPPPAYTSADPQPNGNLAPPSAAAAASDVIQNQDSNVSGIVAEIIQARRSDGVLSIKLRFRNTDSKAHEIHIIETRNYPAFYVTASNKKYFILKDTDGTYLAPETNSWDHSTLQVNLDPGHTYTWWAKYPAPPDEVKKITFITPVAPPFEDVPLSDH
jgi:hypothetical protein